MHPLLDALQARIDSLDNPTTVAVDRETWLEAHVEVLERYGCFFTRNGNLLFGDVELVREG